jgi:hypothetical protein
MGEHGASIVGGEAAWLSTEVKEDSIRFPAAKGANSHFVYARDKEGGGAPGAEAVGINAVRGDVSEMEDSGGSAAQFRRDVAHGDIMDLIGRIVVAVEGASRTRAMLMKV